MGLPEEERNHSTLLRKRAEEALQGKIIELDDLSSQDIQYLIHELQVHQAEMAIQNEEMRLIQLDLEASRDQYSNLYNFAPAGYCTINRKDRIIEANQTLADLLGVAQKKLIQSNLNHFVSADDQDKYYLFRKRAFEQQQRTEIRLVKPAGDSIYVRLESKIVHDDANRLMVMLIDISKERELQSRLVEQREMERKKLASDLHDGPVQALAAITFNLREVLLDHPDIELIQALEKIQDSLREQIQVLRNVSVELRPPLLKHLGLEKAIRSYVESIREKHPEFDVQLQLPEAGPQLSETASITLFRICQEALTNIGKHARTSTTQVIVRLETDQHNVRLEVKDNGDGFDPPAQWIDFAQQGRLGLLGMREHAEAIGGHLEIQSSPGKGTHVVAVIPLNHSRFSHKAAG